jgi:hypothetical protein
VYFAPYRTQWAETPPPPRQRPSLARRLLDRLRTFVLRAIRRRALRAYVARLGPALMARYGIDDHYTPRRVRRTLTELKLSERFAPHAVAMYSSAEQFVAELDTAEDADARGLRTLYAMLRSDAAELANRGSQRFLPKVWQDIGMHNGNNVDAAQRWGFPM